MSQWFTSFFNSTKGDPSTTPAMSAPPLTIRNLTATPLTLKLIERYESPEASASDSLEKAGEGLLDHVTDLVTGDSSTPSQPSAPQLKANSKSFARRDVDIHINPFEIRKTEIKATERGQSEILRLTFEAGGQKYRIDTPSPKFGSQKLIPLGQQPKFDFTGVFLPGQTWLSVYSSANLNCWMKYLKDATPLSALSIPGTHNSPTYHRALPSVRCQAVSPREQLDNGVRFFDIRVQPESPTSPNLQLVHGVFPISLTGAKQFRDLLKDIYTFLDTNPSETLVLSLKREGTGNCTDQNLGRILFDHYTSGPEARRWYTDPRIPTLGEVRGKIVLIRRFAIGEYVQNNAHHQGRGWGIEAQNWADNTPYDLHGDVCVQDFYEVLETENIEKKTNYAQEHLRKAAECICHLPGITTDKTHPVPPQPFYLNFLSASNFWKVGCWPDKIAAKLNPAIVDWLCRKHAVGEKGDGGTGIVICDWVGANGDWDLVRCIVGMNSKLMLREMSL